MEKGIKFQEFYAKFSYLVIEGHITTQDLKNKLNIKL
jgi:hypothetical protein